MRGLPGSFSFPTLDEKLDPRETALVIVSVQNDFCDPNGAFAASPDGADLILTREMREPLLKLLETARATDCLRVFVRSIYDPSYCAAPIAEKLVQSSATRGHPCLEGTSGADYWEPFRPRRSDREVEVVKHRYSAFFGTNLAVILRANAIRTAVIAGVLTSVCIDSTVRDAMFEDFFAVVPADTSADYAEERHRVHLQKLASGFATISTADEVIGSLRRERETKGLR